MMSRLTPLCRAAAVWVIVLTALTTATVAAQVQPSPSSVPQESAPPVPPRTPRPRVEVAVGLTLVRVRELPPRDNVGQGALSGFAGAGYLWTPHLLTQVEITSQIESSNWDYGNERVVAPGRVATITLKHNYDVSRWTVAQLFQLGSRPLVPYLGGGVGVESQRTYDSWYESRVVLGPEATTVSGFPDASISRGDTNHVIVFGEAGAKIFLGRHMYFVADFKYAGSDNAKGAFGLGVRFP